MLLKSWLGQFAMRHAESMKSNCVTVGTLYQLYKKEDILLLCNKTSKGCELVFGYTCTHNIHSVDSVVSRYRQYNRSPNDYSRVYGFRFAVQHLRCIIAMMENQTENSIRAGIKGRLMGIATNIIPWNLNITSLQYREV